MLGGNAIELTQQLIKPSDPEMRKELQEQLDMLLVDPKVELWFYDECGVEGDPPLAMALVAAWENAHSKQLSCEF